MYYQQQQMHQLNNKMNLINNQMDNQKQLMKYIYNLIRRHCNFYKQKCYPNVDYNQIPRTNRLHHRQKHIYNYNQRYIHYHQHQMYLYSLAYPHLSVHQHNQLQTNHLMYHHHIQLIQHQHSQNRHRRLLQLHEHINYLFQDEYQYHRHQLGNK